MKKTITAVSGSIILLLASSAFAADVEWLPSVFDGSYEYNQFTYSVSKNGGTFFQKPMSFNTSSDTGTNAIDNVTSGNFAAGVATSPNEGGLSGVFDMLAGGNGSGAATSPPDGVTAQAYAEMKMTGFNTGTDGVAVEQQVSSSVIRRFRVSQDGTFNLTAELLGQVDFTDFSLLQTVEPGPGFLVDVTSSASHTLVAEAWLEKFSIINGSISALDDPSEVRLSLSPGLMSLSSIVDLVSQTPEGYEVFYNLGVKLNLTSDLTTFDFMTGSTLAIPDGALFALGTETDPLLINASIGAAPISTPIPGSLLLLLSGLGGLGALRRRFASMK